MAERVQGGAKSLQEEEDFKDTQHEGDDLEDSQVQQDGNDGNPRTPKKARWMTYSPTDKTSADHEEDNHNDVGSKSTSITSRFN